MIKADVVQGTPEWEKARLGIPTASNFDKIVTIKGEPSKQREKYMYQLAAERITGFKESGYQNGAMLRGMEIEAQARAMYEFMTDNEVEQVGFCYYDSKKDCGCSPDGLVRAPGMLEIKCPTSAVHVGYLLAQGLPTAYFQQTQGQLFVTGREWVDFFSFYPSLKPLLIRVKPDKLFINKLRVELEVFCHELDQITEKIKGA